MRNKINSKKLDPMPDDGENDVDGTNRAGVCPYSDRECGYSPGDESGRIDWDDLRMYLAHNQGSDQRSSILDRWK